MDVNEGDATLAFMEKSNNYHTDFKLEFNINDKDNWYKLTREQEDFYVNKGCDYKKIKWRAGTSHSILPVSSPMAAKCS